MKKLKAFTLIELIVVLILSGLVVCSAGVLYYYAQRNFQIYKSSNELLLNTAKLKMLLDNDFFRSKIIEKSGDEVMFINDSNIVKIIFNGSNIIRIQNEVSDNLPYRQSNVEFFMNSNEVKTDGLIDEMILTISLNDSTIKYHFLKEYDAVQLMHKNRIGNI